MAERTNEPTIEAREEGWRLATRLVRGGTRRSELGEVSEAIFLTAGFRYDEAEEAAARFKGESDGYTYSRLGNPTLAMLERRLALLEGAEACRVVATGMAAVTAAILCQVKAGDRVVAARALFGSCRYVIDELLPRFGVTTVLVDGPDLEGWKAALAPGARCVFLESPANPTLELVDIKAVCEIAHQAGARVIVDNVFATPLAQRPLELGADIVVYSATKYIDGQGRCLGGAILGDAKYVNDVLLPFLRHTGPALSPFNAWVLLKGLETFKLRVDAHCRAAAKVADWLAGDKRVLKVLYPHRADHPQAALAQRQMRLGGGVVSFDVPGGSQGAFRVMNALRVIDISNNLGDTKSLVTHPTTTTHQRLPAAERQALGIGDGLLRLSVGLEDVEDLIEDLDRALRA
ncbi:O-succinylhomoserine sulfhydrylase [Desertibaculum subflavum]|uniref:O-succinylhomoserine sulfhydrylase n=1 Tax=Desertibaculum subflavum TaxID=2268458 RepID=UPI000E662A71